MTYLIYDISFYKVDDEGEAITDTEGKVKVYNQEI